MLLPLPMFDIQRRRDGRWSGYLTKAAVTRQHPPVTQILQFRNWLNPGAYLSSLCPRKRSLVPLYPFPNDSAGGPDGLRPQHLKDRTVPTTNGGAQALISALSRFVTVVLQGKTPGLFLRGQSDGPDKEEEWYPVYWCGLHPASAGCQGFRLQGEGQDGYPVDSPPAWVWGEGML